MVEHQRNLIEEYEKIERLKGSNCQPKQQTNLEKQINSKMNEKPEQLKTVYMSGTIVKMRNKKESNF